MSGRGGCWSVPDDDLPAYTWNGGARQMCSFFAGGLSVMNMAESICHNAFLQSVVDYQQSSTIYIVAPEALTIASQSSRPPTLSMILPVPEHPRP